MNDNTTTCSSCNNEIHFGQFPFCPHEYMPGREPQQFTPIIVHRRLLDNGDYQYSYPGQASDPVSPGYEKMELSTLAQADRFVKDRDREENELRTINLRAEQQHWDERTNERRKHITAALEERLGKSNSQVFDLVKRYVDGRRAQRYAQLNSRQTGFHSEVLSFDKSNRKEYIDDSKKRISIHVNRS